MGANIPGKPRLFLPYIGGVGHYRARCAAVADAGYRGFALSGGQPGTGKGGDGARPADDRAA
jgi:cyclohexanone monooxygenase